MTRYTLLLALCACGGDFSADPSAPLDTAPSTQGPQRDVSLRVNVIASRSQEANGEDAVYRALPQTVALPPVRQDSGYDMGDVELLDPVVQSGTITAYQVNPSIATIPGEDVPVEGFVRLRLPDTVQSYAARSDAFGRFSAWALPDPGYRLEVVPDDPLLPMYTGWIEELLPGGVTDPPQALALDLGAGVPIYGRISSAAVSGLADAKIHVVDAFGATSSTALSDELGLYQIRVTPGTWTVVCEGRDNNGKDPTLRFEDLVVGDAGLNLDIAYPTDLASAYVEGAIEDLDGVPLDGATIRLTTESLDGYEAFAAPGLSASWSTDVTVNKTGFVSRVVPGLYTVEALPPEDADELSPARRTGVALGTGTTELEPIELGPRVPVTGTVAAGSGERLGSSHVVCREIGFDERSWELFTGEQGNFTIDLPTVPVACEASAPSSRSDLATGRVVLDPSELEEPNIEFVLSGGQLISGRVVSGGDPEPYVVIEIRDQTDRVLGVGLTGEDGVFSVPVDLSTAE